MTVRVFVTGGSGLLGRAFVPLLVARSDVRVTLLTRTRGSRMAGLDVIEGDLREHEPWEKAARAADVIVHAAGVMHHDANAMDAVNVDATRHLLDAAFVGAARRFVYVSSVAVYGDDPHRTIPEQTVQAARSAYARSKGAAEDMVRRAHDEGQFTTCVLRPCPILGPGAGHFAHGIAQLVRLPVVPLPDGGVRPLDLVDVVDAARAVVAAACDRPTVCGAVNLASGEPRALRDHVETVARALGVAPAFDCMTIEEARVRNGHAERAGAPLPVPSALIEYARVERTYATTRMRDELGVVPQRSIDDALVAAVRVTD
ncbi:MAG: NAD-dependent epimerase/dehydratase family protein [Planctomycetes bacterium]|nr:NAD-dependent epimerase/dehydratase family protein [Planctomycetota bacterium]MCC7172488.1 NAD-dependent epimerase/dehydratase family protein [Planctomycetota bacterium]